MLLEGFVNDSPALIDLQRKVCIFLPKEYTLLRTETDIVGALAADGRRVLFLNIPLKESDKIDISISMEEAERYNLRMDYTPQTTPITPSSL